MPEIIDNIEVGKFIKTLLKRNNMTQDALASKLMISKSAVSQNLNGKSSFDIQNLMTIAKIFNISLDDILNCRYNEEEDNYISEYVKFATKGLKEIEKHKASDLQIQDPDIYGKVLVDYLIDQDIEDVFVYLHQNEVNFVRDYYHRAEEIYLKIIIYMLRKNIDNVISYIKKYSEIHNSFDITQTYNGLEVWSLLNKLENKSIIIEIMNLEISQHYTVMGIKRNKMVQVMTKDLWLECIGTYKLDYVLDCYLESYASEEDLLMFNKAMLLYEYSDGVEKFINKFYNEEINSNAKSYYNFQKSILLVVKKGDIKLFKKYIEMGIFESLTGVIVNSINEDKKLFYEYCLNGNEQKILNNIDYSKVGVAAVKKSNTYILNLIKQNLNKSSLDYLLSEVLAEDIEMLYYLVSNGARYDFKYYNSNTMKNSNAIIDFLYKKDVN